MSLFHALGLGARDEGYEEIKKSLLFLHDEQVMMRGVCGQVVEYRECSGGRMGPHAGRTIGDWPEPYPT
jgi:hypothetical protein